MEREYETRVKRELRSVEQCIREAKERQARGEPNADAEVNKLCSERVEKKREVLTANKADYVIDRNRKREQRSKLQKIKDALIMDR